VNLPDGLTSRPLTIDDAAAVAELVRAEETADVGAPETTYEDVLGDWQRPTYDLALSTIGVHDGAALVGYAEVVGDAEVYTSVHPDHRGRGIGTALAAWARETARGKGYERVASQVPVGGPADRLMTDLGYEVRWVAWNLELSEGTEIAAQPLPDGYTIREAAPTEHEAAYHLVEDAFTEWEGRSRQSLEDFGARVWGRPGFAPWNLRVVVDPEGVLVGATHIHLDDGVGYLARIAVVRDRRGLGLARAMLAEAFGLAREHGAVRCYLSTDSRTGALGLYEKVGMVISSQWVNRALAVD
jgi:mycothiol synthase